MKKLSCSIFVGSKGLQDELTQRINLFDGIDIVKIFNNKIEMIEEMNHKKTDIFFINIDQDNINALEVMKVIQRPAFTFAITANRLRISELLDNGYFDYLTPKLDLEVFCKKISKLLNIKNSLDSEVTLSVNEAEATYRKSKKSSVQPNTIFLKHKKTRCRMALEDIALIVKAEKGIKVETAKGRTAYHDATLKQMSQALPKEMFIRINKSAIVNFNKIERVEQNVVHICRQTLNVSRIFAPALRNMIRKYSVEQGSRKAKKLLADQG
jgi:DNA-binding LytR/AlgR family response regulator